MDNKVKELASVLRELSQQKRLDDVLERLEKSAPDTGTARAASDRSGGETSGVKSYHDLVQRYHGAQIMSKKGASKGKEGISGGTSSLRKSPPSCFSLNFEKFRQDQKAFRRMTPNTQVVGFTNIDSHSTVLTKAAQGLGLTCSLDKLALICSGGLVPNVPLNDEPWCLGKYIEQYGGTANRSKKVWGVYIPIDVREELEETQQAEVPAARKRNFDVEHSSLQSAKKKRSLVGTSKETAYSISSSSTDEPMEVDFGGKVVVKYSPVIGEDVCSSVILAGRTGAWRALHLDFVSSEDEVKMNVDDEIPVFQPDTHGYIVTHISIDQCIYLFTAIVPGEIIPRSQVKYVMREKRLVHSKRCVDLSPDNSAVPLFVISNEHGNVHYDWHQRPGSFASWQHIDMPSHTCVLYVSRSGEFKCTVGSESVIFLVKGPLTKTPITLTEDFQVGFEDLEIGEFIGKGSFAVVHKGKWNGMEVAMKRINVPPGTDSTKIASNKEIAVLRSLNHPHITSLLAFSVTDTEVVIVMNYVQGSNLDRLLFGKMTKKFTSCEALALALKVTQAVDYMHSREPAVIHQDLKPQNVLVSDDLEVVKVCDMGIAKLKSAAEATKTSLSKGPGTYPYMAPEMFKKGHRSKPVDVYSLGCLLIELFGRRRVWPGLDAAEIMMKVLGTYDSPPQRPDTSFISDTKRARICSLCCHLEPQSRPSIGEVLQMIVELSIPQVE